MKKAVNITALLLTCLMACTAQAETLSQKLTNTQNLPTARIVGGARADISQVPATVALLSTARVELDGNLFQAQFCAGTVIAPQWVLTAAHCVSDLQGNVTSPAAIQVLTGSSNLNAPVNQPIEVVNIITHEDYVSVQLGQDIALLELAIDAQVQAALINSTPVEQDEEAFIAGWGGLDIPVVGTAQRFPVELQGATVNMTPGDSCATQFSVYTDYLNDTMICAGIEQGGRDACQGDSGGPMYRTTSADNRVSSLAGITSWGISCGLAEAPGVYTNVSSYIDWIENFVGDVTIKIDTPANDDSIASDIENSSNNPSTDVIDSGDNTPSTDATDSGDNTPSTEETDSDNTSPSTEETVSNDSGPTTGGTVSNDSIPTTGGTVSNDSVPTAGGTDSNDSVPTAGGTNSSTNNPSLEEAESSIDNPFAEVATSSGGGTLSGSMTSVGLLVLLNFLLIRLFRYRANRKLRLSKQGV